ncbi:MAG TPA: DUF58 domain-containing protein [Acidimicrobiales bacterium]|nr:DUF58 domain-containing protein [Acidimicrobiales bacterium]
MAVTSAEAPAQSQARARPAPAGGPRRSGAGPWRRLLARLDRWRDAAESGSWLQALGRLQRRVGLTATGIAALGAGVVIWIVAKVVAGTAMYLFAYGALLIVILALAIAPRRLRLEGERTGLYPRAHEGDRLDVEVRLTAQRRVTTFMLEERVPERLGNPVRVPITQLSPGSEVTHHYGLRCTRRGVYQVGPLVAVAGDPLGMAERETVVAEPFELLVHPRVELVSDRPLTRQFEDPPIRPPVSKPWPSGLEFYGMREYVPGDDLRRIVWRASARVGRVMVREAEQGITDRITLILDTDRTHHSRDGQGLSESFETGIRAVASLGVRHLREGYEVRTEANGGPLTRPLRGGTAQLSLLDALARIELDREPLSKCLRRLLANGQRDAHNILVTPHLGQNEAATLRLLLNTGVSVLVVALLWDEESDNTLATAASLGCQVAGMRPGDDLATALAHDIGAGNRL